MLAYETALQRPYRGRRWPGRWAQWQESASMSHCNTVVLAEPMSAWKRNATVSRQAQLFNLRSEMCLWPFVVAATTSGAGHFFGVAFLPESAAQSRRCGARRRRSLCGAAGGGASCWMQTPGDGPSEVATGHVEGPPASHVVPTRLSASSPTAAAAPLPRGAWRPRRGSSQWIVAVTMAHAPHGSPYAG